MKDFLKVFIPLIMVFITIAIITLNFNQIKKAIFNGKYQENMPKIFDSSRKTHGFGTYAYGLKFDGKDKHYGIDYDLPIGTKVKAVEDGTVTRVFKDKLGGNVLQISEANGTYHEWYMHLDKIKVQTGDHVKKGDIIALSGNSGRQTTGPHLHFQRMKGGVGNKYAFDPKPYIEEKPNKENALYELEDKK
ncbi:M23 family peptidase [Staphylococcus massiliensis CCUG 55927]|uniref:lysostaphin n=2 Tax=Staphylococcus massiliensis TaxID=555791 RepID=K9AV95_9STAP|nr:M23 family metallopeptidase [Staphylococcus massiliensis]EKU50026.1 peptidase [Staphylococcus massiliensis S46]MCG3402267.1 M23 family metallopeptidase [Staphylococcus massiliensis]POA00288.1 M23 family peptidase [Staphylococcus massiliensis CCUG 55927]